MGAGDDILEIKQVTKRDTLITCFTFLLGKEISLGGGADGAVAL